MEWIVLAQDTERWRAVVNAIMNLPVSIKCGEFFDNLRTCWLLRKDSAPWNLLFVCLLRRWVSSNLLIIHLVLLHVLLPFNL